MNRRHYALQNLTEEREEVEVGHAQFVQEFAELEGEERVFGGMHESREETILDQNC